MMHRRTIVIPTKSDHSRQRVQRTPVLMVLHSDSWIEIYGEHLDVHVATKLCCTTPETEILAEEYLYQTMPRRFLELYFSNKLCMCGQCEKRTAEAELQRRHNLEFVRLCNEIREVAK